MVEVAAIVMVAMVKMASNTSKVTKAAHRALECHSYLAHTSPVESLAIGPRTADKPYGGFCHL